MALVKYGNGVAAIAGKIAGNVFARNKAGAYIRAWAKPTSTPTMKQTQVRARFGNQSAAWGALSPAQRDGWNGQAPGTQVLNRLGDPYVPTGRQLFLSANNQLVQIGQAQILDVPANFTPPEIDPTTIVTPTGTTGTLTALSLDVPTDPTGPFMSIEATAPMADIKTNLTNVYRYVGTIELAGTSPYNILTQYVDLYGNDAPDGNVIWFRLKTIDDTNGMSSSYLIYKATVI